jgi:hypothetical protein
MTNLGLLMMNRGEAIAGNGRLARMGGSLDMNFTFKKTGFEKTGVKAWGV